MIQPRLLVVLSLALTVRALPTQAQTSVAPMPAVQDLALQEGECSEGIEQHQPRLQLKLDPETGQLEGVYTATLVNPYTRPLSQACFVLNPGLKIESLSLEGLSELRREPPEGDMPLAYRLVPAAPLAPGSRHALRLSFAGTLVANPKFGRLKPDDVFLTSQSFFYPRFDRAYRRFCPLQVRIELPAGYLPVLSGDRRMGQVASLYETGLETLCGLGNEQGFDLAGARYKAFETPKLTIYHRPDKLRAEQLQDLANEQVAMRQVLAEQFGAHGFERFQLVESNREDLGGMAKANTVFLSDKYFGAPKAVAKLQYEHFKQLPGGEAGVPAEFAFYRRSVLAHESAHLFFNHYYDHDKPWFAEGLPEFASLKVLEALGDKAALDRKLAGYRQTWAQISERPLPALNAASLDGKLPYLVNYQGTPLALWGLSQSRPDFWTRWRDWLADRSKALSYAGFKAHFKLTPAEAARFETAFEPEGL